MYVRFFKQTGTFQIGAIWFVGALLAVFSTAAISGAHLNPAVSLSFLLIRPKDFSTGSFIEYTLAQLVGGILAGIVNFLLFRPAIGGEFTQTTASAFGDYWSESSVGGPVQAMLVEAFGTAVLTFVVFAATNPKNNVPDAVVPVLVASAIGGVISVLGSTTGAGINPARGMCVVILTITSRVPMSFSTFIHITTLTFLLHLMYRLWTSSSNFLFRLGL